jgi:hypothetical protein
MLTWIKALFAKPPCRHPNIVVRKSVLSDGTGWVSASCPDCNFRDFGHVHIGDPNKWLRS